MSEPAVQDEVDEETLVSEGQMDVVDEPIAEPPTVSEPVAEPPAEPEPVAKAVSAIWNGSFEKWGTVGPTGWRVMDVGDATGVAVIQCEDTPHGSTAVKLVPAEVRSAISQSFTLPEEYEGKKLRLSADIKSAEEGMTGINLYYVLAGSRKAVKLEDAGTGEWTVSTAEFVVPRGVDFESFSILVNLRENAKEAACVDNIRLDVLN